MAKPPRSLVLGTAGHIDHGKTTLVRALTGMDTDRLPEEKRRGITIELGFAPWQVTPEIEASIVDVPGHEAFVRTMVAGAGGIDAVILVVSAEDGVMPQTREHINVCKLLGVSAGVVALTKVDRLQNDPESIELAVDDVREALAGTVFEDAPILPCSGHTGVGLDELRAAIVELTRRLPRRDIKGDPILPLDRVFSMKGHGTVVTGTLLQGTVDVEHRPMLQLVPHGNDRVPREVRARGAQVRGDSRGRVFAGARLAVNLGGIEVDALRRGDVLTEGSTVRRADTLHAWLQHLPGPGTPWKPGSSLQVCIGTAHAIGRIDPLWVSPVSSDSPGDVTVPPGREGLVRIHLDGPLPLWRNAPIVVRAFSDPSRDHQGLTVGGGVVIDPEPSEGRGQRQRWISVGRTLRDGSATERVAALVRDAKTTGLHRQAIARRSGVSNLDEVLQQVTRKGGEVIALGSDRFVDEHAVRPLIGKAITLVDRFHADNPVQPGLSRAALESMLGTRVAPDVAALVVTRALERGALRVVDDQGTLARPGKGVGAGAELPAHMQRVFDLYAEGGITPPTLREVQASAGLPTREVLEIVGVLQRTGRLIKITPELSLAGEHHQRLVDLCRERLQKDNALDVQALKAMTGLTRKFAVPFLEHLDTLQVTVRRGDTRVRGPRA